MNEVKVLIYLGIRTESSILSEAFVLFSLHLEWKIRADILKVSKIPPGLFCRRPLKSSSRLFSSFKWFYCFPDIGNIQEDKPVIMVRMS